MSFQYGEQPNFDAQQPVMAQPDAHSHDDTDTILKSPIELLQPINAMEQTLSVMAENQHPMTQPLSADEILKPQAPIAPVAPVMPMVESGQSLSARVAEMEAKNANLERENGMLRNDIARLEANCAELESLRAKAQRFEMVAMKLQALSAEIAGQ